MKNYWILLIFVLMACNTQPDQAGEKNSAQNNLKGNWQFLDRNGTYNEALFFDSSFQTFNRFMGDIVLFRYSILNDSMYVGLREEKDVLSPIARLEWLNKTSWLLLQSWPVIPY